MDPTPPLEGDLAELSPYSDGVPWNEDRVLRHIHHHLEQIIVSAYEIGRALLHTKATLGHGSFEGWVRANLPFSERTARNYMQVGEFLTAHPRLREPLAKARLKNVMLLTALPPELRDELVGEGHLAEVSPEELGTMPYVELKKLKERLEKQIVEQNEKLETLQGKLDERTEALAAATTRQITGNYPAQLKKTLDTMRRRVEAMMEELGFDLDTIAQRWDEIPPAQRAEVDGALTWLEVWVRHEVLRHATLRGDPVVGADIDDNLAQLPPAGLRVPEHRHVPRFGSEG